MTPTDEQFDVLIGDALAVESWATTDRLAQQIGLLTDDALSASLDAAMGSMDVPEGLADRILFKTSGVPGVLRVGGVGVLAGIGPTVGWLLAALVVLSVSWLGWLPMSKPVPVDRSVVSAVDVLADDEIELELEMIALALDDFALGDAFDDHETFDLEWQIMLDTWLNGSTF